VTLWQSMQVATCIPGRQALAGMLSGRDHTVDAFSRRELRMKSGLRGSSRRISNGGSRRLPLKPFGLLMAMAGSVAARRPRGNRRKLRPGDRDFILDERA